MIIENIKNGKRFETTPDEYRRLISEKGYDYKYRIIEDDVPFEIKSMRELKDKREIKKKNI